MTDKNPFGKPAPNEDDDFDFDFSGIDENPFVVKPGVYVCTVLEAIKGLSSSGNSRMAITWSVDTCVSVVEGVPNPQDIGKDLRDFVTVQANTLWRVKRMMGALGAQAKMSDMLGKSCQIKIQNRIWNEELQNDFKKFMPLDPGAAQKTAKKVARKPPTR